MFANFAANYTGTLVSPPIYVGEANCIECHEERHALWASTIHATAFDTLTASGDGDNVLCFPCHSVGYGKPSGFVSLDTSPHLAHVQCENCHGPGSNHAADPDNVHLHIDYDADLCGADVLASPRGSWGSSTGGRRYGFGGVDQVRS